jgi:hypothetical protein
MEVWAKNSDDGYAYTSDAMAKNMQEFEAQKGIDAFLEYVNPSGEEDKV